MDLAFNYTLDARFSRSMFLKLKIVIPSQAKRPKEYPIRIR